MRMADRHLVDKCLNGDSAAFGMLVDRYKESVYALAYSRLRNFHDAEDVTQEAFTKAYQKLRTLRRWDEFHVWIYAITSNLCKDWIKAKSRRPDREFIADHSVRSLSRYSGNLRNEDTMLEVLNEALDSLPESYRQVLTLHYLGGMDGTEIAQFLGMSPSANLLHGSARAGGYVDEESRYANCKEGIECLYCEWKDIRHWRTGRHRVSFDRRGI